MTASNETHLKALAHIEDVFREIDDLRDLMAPYIRVAIKLKHSLDLSAIPECDSRRRLLVDKQWFDKASEKGIRKLLGLTLESLRGNA